MAVPDSLKTSYEQDMRLYEGRSQVTWLWLLVLFLALFPFLVTRYYVDITNQILIAIPGALALNLLMGVSGQASVGNAAFMAIGGITSAVLGAQAGWPFIVVLLASGFFAAAAGVVVGFPSLRLRGLYLIVATLALHYIMVYALHQYQGVTTGPQGFSLPRATLAGWALTSDTRWYFLLLVVAIVVTLCFVNLVRSSYGRAWMAIRDREISAEVIGVNVPRYKMLVFVVSSFIIGIQGSLFAYYIQVVNVETFTLDLAIKYVAMVIIGGVGSAHGAIFGAIFVTGLPYLVRALADQIPEGIARPQTIAMYTFDVQLAIYGLAIVLFLIFEPAGLVAIWRRIRTRVALWPFAREGS